MNFRSCRDSGITGLARAGVDLARMQRRAGHDDIKTTLDYVKLAEDLTGKIGVPFGPLPEDLCGGPSAQDPPKTRGIGCRRRESLSGVRSPAALGWTEYTRDR